MQASLDFQDALVPLDTPILAADVTIDRGSRYGFAISKVVGKESLAAFLKHVRSTKPFSTASHCSYAFRMRSPEGILVEWKGDDGETGAGLCILRELRRMNVEQCVLVVSRHFGGTYLQADRFKNVVDVARLGIEKIRGELDGLYK